jgi:methanogenic corrinoid protein MtbC1
MSWLKSMMEKEPPEPENPIGTIVIGNLEPDRMNNPKDMVRKSLTKAGFKCVDVGSNVPADKFASKAKEVNADIIAVSINLSAAKNNLPQLMTALETAGLQGKTILMIGGAAIDKNDADKLCALYGKTREEAVAIAKQAVGK